MTTQNVRRGTENVINRTVTGVTDWIKLNKKFNPFEVALAVYIDAGSVGVIADVQYTVVEDPDAAPASAIRNHPTITGVTDYDDGNFDFPVSAVRLNVLQITSGGVNFSVAQPGSG